MLNKDNFPIFKEYPNLIYLDSAATSQKPKILIDALADYYFKYNSNIGRGMYELAEKSHFQYEQSKLNIAKFFNTSVSNLIFTSGATDSLNSVYHLLKNNISKNSKILISIFEHHSNLLIWQKLAKEYNLEIEFIKDINILMHPENLSHSFFDNVSTLILTHCSNVNGTIFPIKKWIDICKDNNVISIIDGSQGVSSCKVDLNDLNPDFYSFSAHKLYGPMGLGVLYIDKKYLKFEPFRLGGGIVDDVSETEYSLLDGILKFEAGTPNVANIYAFSEVLNQLYQDFDNHLSYIHSLNTYLLSKISSLNFIKVIPSYSNSSLTSFSIDEVHSHDVGTYLASKNIALRVGKHCAYPLHDFLNVNSTIRVSFGIYNSYSDIDILVNEIINCYNYFTLEK